MTKYVVKVKKRLPRSCRFGWGDPSAADAFLRAAQKANPYHRPGGDEKGGEFTDRDSASVLFEAAPDPNDKELTRRWETLTVEEKEEVSRNIVKHLTPAVLAELKTAGELESQFGGYDDYTNPSFALKVDDAHVFDVARLMGYALSQDSMAVVSSHPIKGLDKVGVVVINLPQADMNLNALAGHYQTLRQLTTDSGEPIVTGFNASGGSMKVLNFSGMSDAKFTSLIDKQLGGKYNVYTDRAYSTLVKDYSSAGNQEAEGGTAAVWRQSADRLRETASRAINGELKRRGKAAVSGLRYLVRRIMRK